MDAFIEAGHLRPIDRVGERLFSMDETMPASRYLHRQSMREFAQAVDNRPQHRSALSVLRTGSVGDNGEALQCCGPPAAIDLIKSLPELLGEPLPSPMLDLD